MSKVSRRIFLQGMLGALATAGCSTIIDQQTQPGLPDVLQPPSGADRHPIAHLLNRATFGPRPGQIEAVLAQGREAWIDQQLDYESLDTTAVNLRLRRYDTLNMYPRDLLGFFGETNRQFVRDELAIATLVRAVYSERQLYEVMVGFWSDHFSIHHYKENTAVLKTIDDREVIRPHALGHFGDLLRASAHSPAMLVYLDNVRNTADMLNENYAREIMELHTLGVDNGYTEADIPEVAKCFTGWTVNSLGEFTFIPEWHAVGEKRVLGEIIHSDDPLAEGERVLDILTNHPNTARYVSSKLVRRFVADDPPESIVSACVQTWNATQGNIREIVRTILTHPEFDNAPLKLKRPFELVTSLLRVTNASYSGSNGLINRLEQMGHRPFGWATPDGYPDTAIEWTGNMLDRWNLCLEAFTGDLPGVGIDVDDLRNSVETTESADVIRFFGRLFLKHDLSASDEAELLRFMDGANDELSTTLGLLAASPAFQWR
ncbi:MAG: DUF1800 domain-containing protein [Aggregatilineales bacterium]